LATVREGGSIGFDSSLAEEDVGFGKGVLGLTLGELVVDKSLSIQGLGADNLTISGNGESLVFLLDDGDNAVASNVLISGLTVADGASSEAGGILTIGENLTFEDGYLARNEGAIATQNSTVAEILVKTSLLFNNERFSLSTNGSLEIVDSRILNTDGTGIEHKGSLLMLRSGIANGTGQGLIGQGTFELVDSQVEQNGSDGIELQGVLTGRNISINGNEGDGIVALGGLTLTNSDVSNNVDAGIIFDNGLRLLETSVSANGKAGIALVDNGTVGEVSIRESFITGNGRDTLNFPLESNPFPVPPEEDRTEINGSDRRERLIGTNKADIIKGFGSKDSLNGKGGNDILEGGSGNDKIIGGAGDDVLGGGKGRDLLRGGSGRDTFVYRNLNEGRDVILDFELDKDIIDLSAIFTDTRYDSATPFEDYVKLGQIGDSTKLSVLDINRSRPGKAVFRDIATLNKVSAADIDASNIAL
ncbi:MAG: hypothetical protein AAFU53_09935, partial [Cyanobacteria bacterium J06632_3]